MPTISDLNVVKALARAYISNGRNKSQGLIEAGYSPVYARTTKAMKLYEKDTVKAEIASLELKITQDAEYTIDDCDADYARIMAASETNKQFSTAATCVTGRARLRGWDRDASTDKQEPDAITDTELDRLKAMANDITKPTLSHNKPQEPRQAQS